MSDMEDENTSMLNTSNSFDSNLNEVEEVQDEQDKDMEDKGDTSLGKKQLLLSQVGVKVQSKKVRTETKDLEVISKDYTFELAVSRFGRSVTHEEGMQGCIDQVKAFITGRKIEEILTHEGKYEVPAEDDESIAGYLLQEQQVVYFKHEYFVAFIKFKTPYDISHIFEGIETPIRVTIRHNHSTILTTRGGYIGRVHPVYGLKIKYEEILN